MPAVSKRRISPEEYLAAERVAEFRSEYYDGEVFAMAGASKAHLRIAANLVGELHSRLKGGPCQAFAADARVAVSRSRVYAYPDVVIACDPVEFADKFLDTLLNPKVIFEILSPSTEKHDRTGMFDAYQTVPSLAEYVLVAQDEPRIERYVRDPADDLWKRSVYTGLEAELALAAVDVVIPLRDVYYRVEFESTD